MRVLLERNRAYARGELNTAEGIRQRFTGGVSANELESQAAKAVARAAGQAVAVPHLGSHALSAAACAVNAVALAKPDEPQAFENEVHWQLEHMSSEVHTALRAIPLIDEISSGPLGPGLNTSGRLGDIIRMLQAGIASMDT